MSGLNWLDPDAVRALLKDVETYTETLIDVAEDQTDAPSKRMYGRVLMATQIRRFMPLSSWRSGEHRRPEGSPGRCAVDNASRCG